MMFIFYCKKTRSRSSHILYIEPLRIKGKNKWWSCLCGLQWVFECTLWLCFFVFFMLFMIFSNTAHFQCFSDLMGNWDTVGQLFSSGAIIATTGGKQHCRDFYGKSLWGWSADFIFWSPALCPGSSVWAQTTVAQLLTVSVANNSNYRQAVKPHEQCPH